MNTGGDELACSAPLETAPGHGFATEDSADLDRGSIEIEGNMAMGFRLPGSSVWTQSYGTAISSASS